MKSIARIAAAYRDGTLTPTQLVARAHERIAAREPALNAFADPMHTASTAAAQAAERALRRGDDLGPLHGIPIAIKDLIDVAGAPTRYGTRAVPPQHPAQDAPLVARLRAAGAIILGKTQCLEYAYGVAHPEIGQTNNPHDTRRTAGGSSGGSAAAVAAGIVPAAIGTDTGGSIRIPAAYCGIVGLKPTYGRVPLDGVFPLSQSLDHAGPLTHTVADAALVLGCIAKAPLAPVDAGPPRIGILRAHFPSDPENRPVGDAVDAALQRLTGVSLRDTVIPGLAQANAILLDILLPEAAAIHAALSRSNPAGYAPGTLAQIRAGAALPDTRYRAALKKREWLRAKLEDAFEECDVLVSPTVPFTAPFEDPEIAEGGESEMLATGFSNLTGHPSIALPCGMAHGLPVSLQLTGRHGQDAALLSIAARIERQLAR